MNEVKQLEKFLINVFKWNCEKTAYFTIDLAVSKYKTLHDFYFNGDLYPGSPSIPYDKWRRKWRIYFEALLEIKDLPDNIRESISNILIMDSL